MVGGGVRSRAAAGAAANTIASKNAPTVHATLLADMGILPLGDGTYVLAYGDRPNADCVPTATALNANAAVTTSTQESAHVVKASACAEPCAETLR